MYETVVIYNNKEIASEIFKNITYKTSKSQMSINNAKRNIWLLYWLLLEIKIHLSKFGNILCSWTEKLNTLKIVFFSQINFHIQHS